MLFRKKVIAITTVLLIVFLGTVSVYIFYVKLFLERQYELQTSNTNIVHAEPEQTSSTSPITKVGASPTDRVVEPLVLSNPPRIAQIAGELQPLNRDLKLYTITHDALNNIDSPASVEYYDAGMYVSDKYDGYHRIIAVAKYNAPGYPSVDTFATKDFIHYIFDNTEQSESNYVMTNLNVEKVNESHALSQSHPLEITLINHWYLQRLRSTITDNSSLSNLQPLVVEGISGLVFYALDMQIHDPDSYFSSSTLVYVKDSTGLMYEYELVHKASAGNIAAQTHIIDEPETLIADSKNEFYKNYSVPLEMQGCGFYDFGNVTRNIFVNDLEQVATTTDKLPIYSLRDKLHPLNEAQYQSMIQKPNEEFWQYLFKEKGLVKPTYEEYIQKHPLLFMYDPWNRLVAFGEVDYFVSDGCGKPVIYLYPTHDQEVKISFAVPTTLTTQIPKYASGWKVLAHSDGTLTDLQPEETNCDSIDFTQRGSEYAKDACRTHVYPYLYWSGNVENHYPTPTTGWIMAHDDLRRELDDKLMTIGLNAKERADMLEYWIPEMLKRGTPYYRVSLLQTSELNQFIPMHVTPIPETTIRVFLDWAPLDQKPATPIAVQTLIHTDRNGFTYVEWGGLKYP